jgi:signal transduction histidine kinase
LFALLLLLTLFITPATAQPLCSFKTTQTQAGPVIEFTDGEFILANGVQAPTSGWVRAKAPHILRLHETRWRSVDFHTMVGRFRFDRAALGSGVAALYTVGMRNEFTVFVNGKEVFRNFARVSDQKLAWYRPYLAPLPSGALKPGVNEIIIRAVSQDDVGIGRVVLGPQVSVERYYRSQFVWRITAPMAANATMLILGGLAFLLWLGRRQEVELLFLFGSAVLWYVRNYQYFAEDTPFFYDVFNALTIYSTYFATVAIFAFYSSFLRLPRRGVMIAALFAFGVPLSLIHYSFTLSNMILYVPTNLVALSLGVIGVLDLRRDRSIEHIILAGVMLVMPYTAVYDLLVSSKGQGWDGNDAYLSVFSGFAYCTAFLISFGKRALGAFKGLGDANITLEARIAETRAELAASEAARAELVVGKAVAGERERLMQEMHDGIGSNLITALAVARQQKQPASTIKTLSRALGDLKITVDSLEPIQGDLVALIGNLRHRMTRDLRDAGITTKWEVGECKPLPWLDATNSLHILRIFQEAIGNVISHAGASEMRIGCHEEERGGVSGLTAFVADNGVGFAPEVEAQQGKGLANMKSRAESLHGQFDCLSGAGEGTLLRVWLPYVRTMPGVVAAPPAIPS